MGSLAPDESLVETGTYVVTQADVDAGEILNTAIAISNDITDTDEETVLVPAESELSIVKDYTGFEDNDDNGSISVGDDLLYEITATNTGDTSLTNTIINDELTGDASAPIDLAPGESATLSVSYTVLDRDAGNIITNIATAVSDQTELVTDTEEVDVLGTVDLAIEKDSNGMKLWESDPETAFFDKELTYTVTITNNGPNISDGWEAIDTLPDGVTFVSATNEDEDITSIDNGDGTVTFSSDTDIPVGESRSFEFTVQVPKHLPDYATVLHNQIDVVGQNPDPDLLNNHDEDSIDVIDVPKGMDMGSSHSINFHSKGGVNINKVGTLNLTVENLFINTIYTSEESDIITTGFYDGMTGTHGNDIWISGSDLDSLMIPGDRESNGDMGDWSVEDNEGEVLDFEELSLNGIGSLSYNSENGNVALIDIVNGEVVSSNVIATLQPGLDISLSTQSDGELNPR